ncbi:MAG: hypothetical protein L0241_09800 [Planctomycetia bacterium]|nr:hypothetical protein [Planctomycetia bacterium]
MLERTKSVILEPDEAAAPVVFMYLGCVVACLLAIIAWVYYFRGYA